MSVATELLDPQYHPDHDRGHDPRHVPERHLRSVPVGAETSRSGRGLSAEPAGFAAPATVAVLHAPRPEAAPLRLTRRGVLVLALAVAALGAALVWIAALSAPSDAASGPRAGAGAVAGDTAGSVVTVRAGDTLWTIAGRTAPAADPRAEVDRLRALNHLDSVALVPGQQLRLH